MAKTETTIKKEEISVPVEEPAKKSKIAKVILSLVLVVVVIGLAGTSYHFYHKYKTAPSVETEDVVAKVGMLMDLPADEKPTLATVTDRDKMKEQTFFAKSENGDKVLIYSQALRAILYRPSSNKIIEVMPLSVEKNGQPVSGRESSLQDGEKTSQVPNQAQSVPQEIRVAVYNGSGVAGKAATLGAEIGKVEGAVVVEKTNAAGNFDATLVIDLNGVDSEKTQKIAEAVGGKIGEMPVGEIKPEADILVIAGKK